MSTFTAVVTAHDQDPTKIIGQLMYQTRKPDEILVFCSDVDGVDVLAEDFKVVDFIEVPNMNDWGHAKRAQGVELASGDYLGFFSADDRYDAMYVESMMAVAEEHMADAVFCDWFSKEFGPMIPAAFKPGSSTSGNFIVRTAFAREKGYTDRHYEADGAFISKLAEDGKVVRVGEVLYGHNVK